MTDEQIYTLGELGVNNAEGLIRLRDNYRVNDHRK